MMLIWLRRDLRLEDSRAINFALLKAKNDQTKLQFVFVFDSNILNKLEDKEDPRVDFIWRGLKKIENKLERPINILYGDPAEVIPQLAQELNAQAVVCHRDYEVYAKTRDKKVRDNLKKVNIDFIQFKDHVILEFYELKNLKGDFYKVFTPFKNAWFEKIRNDFDLIKEYEVDLDLLKSSVVTSKTSSHFTYVHSLDDIGFKNSLDKSKFYNEDPGNLLTELKDKISFYHDKRDFPYLTGTSRLSVHLRFGTVSVRFLVRNYLQQLESSSSQGIQVWLSEIAWRDFYFGILDTSPDVETSAYIKKYNDISWDNNKELFYKWTQGQTGVPIVDAAMRELNQTGWMHNRARMIVASYLVKTLLVDWRWGEAYFAKKLIDFDLAANNGGWQWSASTGCDAAPYFRVFNPYRQSERFDPEGLYIKKYCPELASLSVKQIHDPSKLSPMEQSLLGIRLGADYPLPIADYAKNRSRVIELFKKIS
jgi:deoxyribodipyrimidine photo-lyase